MFLTSCGCLVCQNCCPRVLKNGQCLLCRTSEVSAKPIGPNLSTEEKSLFRSLSVQPSFEMMNRREDFKLKHIGRAMQLHAHLGKAYQEKLAQEEIKRKEDEEDLKNIENQLQEKMKKVENLEEEVNQLEQEIEQEQKQKLATDSTVTVEMFGEGTAGETERKDEESYPIDEGSPTASSVSQFLSF